MMKLLYFETPSIEPTQPRLLYVTESHIFLSVESWKGVTNIQRCSVKNQKGAIVIDFVQP